MVVATPTESPNFDHYLEVSEDGQRSIRIRQGDKYDMLVPMVENSSRGEGIQNCFQVHFVQLGRHCIARL